ncbi:hypothetical protein Smp_138350 [Schistosoma mansoni]|uniref:hypothetical protein n=1 Tax=Schistosoma mansoni TaxID=6183 RepID=UPI0001A6403D|nr:hypothetical protein Smp_138350 [Schistosoma mansoni]|eukprot:XP_018651310.1 hypothetical protein Smp_138350 [Schistosoma mansoni]
MDMRNKLETSDSLPLWNTNFNLCSTNKCGSTNCECKIFQPILSNIRQCTNCHHSWTLHVLPKLTNLPVYFELNNSSNSIMLNATLELLSMSLFGCQAIPMRIKILLDRLLSGQLAHADVVRLLLTFGWTFQDYSRGYMLTNPNGTLKDHWEMCNIDEENLIIQQFLRFPETCQLAYLMLSQGYNQKIQNIKYENKKSQDITLGLLSPTITEISPNSTRTLTISSFSNSSSSSVSPANENKQRNPTEITRNDIEFDPLHRMTGKSNCKRMKSNGNEQNFDLLIGNNAAAAAAVSGFPLPPNIFNGLNPFLNNSTLKHSKSLLDSKLLDMKLNEQLFLNKLCDKSDVHCSMEERKHVDPSKLSLTISSNQDILSNSQNQSILNEQTIPLHSVDTSLFGVNNWLPNTLHNLSTLDQEQINSELMLFNSTAQNLSTNSLKSKYFNENHLYQTKRHQNTLSNSMLPSTNNTIPVSTPHHHHSYKITKRKYESDRQEFVKTRRTHTSVSTTSAMTTTMSGDQMNSNYSISNMNSLNEHCNESNGYNFARNKKRVLCTTCKKSFCDKGALKIHYSAVHLKEMHKCTIKGCSMWFSSRRSRNRHSANPNPRLHMAHSSKKLPENATIVDDGSGKVIGRRNPLPNSVLNPPLLPIITTTSSATSVNSTSYGEWTNEFNDSVHMKNSTTKCKSSTKSIYSTGRRRRDRSNLNDYVNWPKLSMDSLSHTSNDSQLHSPHSSRLNCRQSHHNHQQHRHHKQHLNSWKYCNTETNSDVEISNNDLWNESQYVKSIDSGVNTTNNSEHNLEVSNNSENDNDEIINVDNTDEQEQNLKSHLTITSPTSTNRINELKVITDADEVGEILLDEHYSTKKHSNYKLPTSDFSAASLAQSPSHHIDNIDS